MRCLHHLAACLLATPAAAQTFSWNYDLPDREYFPCDQIRTADGGFLVGGDAYLPAAATSRPYLMRLDAGGEIVWQHEYSLAPIFHKAQALVPWINGATLVLADVTEIQKPALFAVTADGDFLASRGYLVGDTELTMNDLVRTRDGGFLVIGRAFHDDSGSDVAILKLDGFGTPQWYREHTGPTPFPVFGADDFGITAVEARAGDGYFVLGLLETDAYLAKLSTDGELLFHRTYRVQGGFLFERGLTFVESAAGGGFVLANVSLSNDLFPLVLPVDAEGHLLSDTADSFPMSTTSAIATTDGGFALGGSTLIVPGAQGLRLAKYDAGGALEWARQHDVQLTFASINPPANLIRAADGGFLLTVAASSGVDAVQHSVRAAADGSGSCSGTPLFGPTSFQVEESEHEVSVASFAVEAPLLPFGVVSVPAEAQSPCD